MIPSVEITGVVSQVETIVEYAGLEDDEEVQEEVENIKESVANLSELLGDKAE